MLALEGFQEVSVVLNSGVYALVRKGVVIYVGQTKSLLARLYTHRNNERRARKGQAIPSWLPVKGFVFDQIFVCPCAVHELDRLEAEMINRYKPRFNQSLKTPDLVSSPITISIGGTPFVLNAPPEPFTRRAL